MLKTITDIFRIRELKKKILFTLGILAVYRIGAAIPTPGIDASALKAFFETQRGTIFGFLDMFSGGALNRLSIFSLGIMPYINASIIMSLLQTAIPYLERLAKEGEFGRRKITQITRYSTLFLAAIQAFGLTFWMQSMKAPTGGSVVKNPGLSFQLITILTLVTGTVFIMWLGEQITEKGVGNGISLIIFAGIVDRLPVAVGNVLRLFRSEEMTLFGVLFLAALVFGITASVVWVEQAQRKIPVQYAKRIIGRKMYGGQSTFLPLKVDQSGVIAVIFAVAIMMFPATVAQFFPNPGFMQRLGGFLRPGQWVYTVMYGGLIVFFCYFYTAITFNPNDLAENMKKWGGFIPGIRPGQSTASYIDRVLTRITMAGALFVVCIAILPEYPISWVNAPPSLANIFGGTAILIVVGVALDTIGQIESHLIMRHYEGFMKKGRIKGRYFNIG
jgi:preprotein translocase subunit SecY